VQLVQEQSPAWEHFTLPVSLLGASQDLTGSWLDCGDEIFCSGYDAVFLFFTIDINDSTDIRIRALGKHTSTGAEEYNLPIKTISSTVVSIDDEYFELANDSDQLVIVQVQTNRGIPYLQVQIEAGTVGASCGQIDALYYTLA